MFVLTITIKNNIMTLTEIYTAIDNNLTDDQRAMDRMDADRDYDLALTFKRIKEMES
jgi:hypothetical protein